MASFVPTTAIQQATFRTEISEPIFSSKIIFMKSLTLILIASICLNCILLLTSFDTRNNNEYPGWPNEPDTLIKSPGFSDTTVGMANIIPTKQAKGYIRNMKRYIWWHHKASSSVWFDKKAIQYLGDFLDKDTANKYDGVRVHLMQYDKKNIAKGQKYRKQLSILFVPTVNKTSDWDALKRVGLFQLDALNHGELCPNNCDSVEGPGGR